jgi:oxygen-independent coproporphyrinogen-3 oxidase
MGLRLAEGVDPARVAARSGGLGFAEAVDGAMLGALVEEGYLAWTGAGRLVATPDGRLRLDALLPALLR